MTENEAWAFLSGSAPSLTFCLRFGEHNLATGSCNITYQGTQYACPGGIGSYAMTRSDGYSMMGGVVQGARTFDPIGGQWTTPDAYVGAVHDPMSQKPFMWNNNNPMQWSDPSGYCADPAPGQPGNGCLGGVDWNLNMRAGKVMDQIMTFAVGLIALPVRAATALVDIDRALHGASSLRVIGGYPSYLQTAATLGGQAFHVAEETWKSLSSEAQWTLNKEFLDQGIHEGAKFVLAPGQWGKATVREVQYLMENGYQFDEGSGGLQELTPQPQSAPKFRDAQQTP